MFLWRCASSLDLIQYSFFFFHIAIRLFLSALLVFSMGYYYKRAFRTRCWKCRIRVDATSVENLSRAICRILQQCFRTPGGDESLPPQGYHRLSRYSFRFFFSSSLSDNTYAGGRAWFVQGAWGDFFSSLLSRIWDSSLNWDHVFRMRRITGRKRIS